MIGFCLGVIVGAMVGLIGGVTGTLMVIERHGTKNYVPMSWIEDEETRKKWIEEVKRANYED